MTKLGVIVGSTRKNSFSKQWADNIVSLYPEETEVEYLDIANLPLYNQDYDENSPQAYTDFREAVKRQDLILFVTPEHNRTMSAALKNALDVASRPWGESVWGGKPALVASHSISVLGGAMANKDVHKSLGFLNMKAVGQPEVILSNSPDLLKDGKAPQGTLDFLQTAVNAHLALL
ncbi:NADPH-dependent FMN reductase [Facklamia miroungae]|uniref:Chromate reductase n=1 Tax=Facklamia miroungae TaxID=120956 RepID=A0A1G7QSA3_9LACT|nr:NAD(P)H-dependent oxidoreductase [Facklamia miroungae]NKZ29046.1 NAD(P)H-dependent oxidoreductase [Facklamia miroungae]SDG01406.1 chromate reductase [Facklamia miroungae]